ncbi:hypothetical protein BJ742DRAFT_323767 [Cladochytrium replicatum]|nr:hypothetical protein BJ742DRAFT_323767 [Cladochytrium replicatum]
MLDPLSDPRGKDITAVMMEYAENRRASLYMIIAGYADDISKKLYAYNDGIKSRFQEIYFEDFDDSDLLSIRNGLLLERGWSADERARLEANKLARQANREGFGNARSVRQKFEEAVKTGMTHDSFSGQTGLLT